MYNEIVNYDVNGAISKLRGLQYRSQGSIWEAGSSSYDIDALLYSQGDLYYRTAVNIFAIHSLSYLMQSVLSEITEFLHGKTYLAGAYNSVIYKRSYRMSGTLEAT
jgi:hypothetical protein